MRAVVCSALGDIDGLVVRDVPAPAIRPGCVRIAVQAAGLNFADTLIVAGKYQVKPPLPFSPGFEVAGEVLECGDDVRGCRPGDKVTALLDWGGFAEQAIASEDNVFVLPAGIDPVIAAAFPVAYGTSHFGLKVKAGLRTGETLLVHGAAGGVGLTAVECGKRLGAIVIATASGAEKQEVARAAGADFTLDARAPDLKDRVKELTANRGVDVVYDPVGGALFEVFVALYGRRRPHSRRRLRLGRRPADPGQYPAGQEHCRDRLLLRRLPRLAARGVASLDAGTGRLARPRFDPPARLARLSPRRGDRSADRPENPPVDRQGGPDDDPVSGAAYPASAGRSGFSTIGRLTSAASSPRAIEAIQMAS